jgi:bifunctional UDP-N-acetylglucosamine pyrophosphorylase / glucosamine-1-phosphate N-acetyltransferase
MVMKWDAIILAAGDGTRMLSKLPKVLHKVAGRPMLVRIIDSLDKSGADQVHVVISKKIEPDLIYLKEIYKNLNFHIQENAKGTADAVASVKAKLNPYVLICNGDHPFINEKDVTDLIVDATNRKSEFSLGVLSMDNPGAFGRVLLDKNNMAQEIIEAKHCTEEQYKIKTVNSGIYFCNTELLFDFLNKEAGKDKSKTNKEFYLTDIVKYLNTKKLLVTGFITTDLMGLGVNDSIALSEANQKAYKLKNLSLMKAGVRFINPDLSFIEDSVEVEPDVTIYTNVYIFGNSKIATGSVLESGVHIKNSQIGPNTMIKAGSYLEGATTSGDSNIGPYAHLREGSIIHKNVKVGNFAEIKNSVLFNGVKAGHQCYLGDAEIGENTNIGAGTITCNFAADGKKYKTTIGKNVFVGSDTQIVPPVTISDDAVLAAGSTVTKDVEAKSLYVTRAKAVVKPNYRK